MSTQTYTILADNNGLNFSSGATAGSSSGSPRMTITSAGNVGIGTSTVNASSGYTMLRINGGSGSEFALAQGGTDYGYMYANSGIFAIATQAAIPLTFQTNATERMRITSGGNVGIGTSSPTNLLHLYKASGAISMTLQTNNLYGYFFNDGTNIGLASDVGTTGLKFIVSRTAPDNAMTITSGGNVLIGGTTGASVRLGAFAATSNGSSYGLVIWNSGGADMLSVRGDGLLFSRGAYDFTTAGGANVNVDADGLVRRSTSSLKYKNNVQNYTKGLADVMQMRPVTYNSNNEDETQTYAGLIAEEIHEIGLTEFVQYADDGTPDALSYSNMVSLLVKAIQEQTQIIKDLEARIVSLESK
jgi:hypothetical protein